jgi:hypothetical protein
VDERIVLKSVFNERSLRMWIGFICFRIRSDCCIQQRTFTRELFSIRVQLKVVANNNNSILYLFRCLLSSAKANYKVGTTKETNRTNTDTQTKDNIRQLVSFRQ